MQKKMISEQETKYKKKERKRDKREQERKIEIDSCKKVQILAYAHAQKTKKPA